ncbi:MAG: bifunctional diguanylate cyclase/phosphodiesterase, partial [Clostridiales bacterium]|nr:bifunctional diguanylate cyclase/phosphodiesterase [Clostridiales bacterium]
DVHKIIDRTTFQDELTGLANRRKFLLEGENIVSQAKQGSKKVALIILDIDRFQRVNNLSGYEAGNKLLVEVANSISSAIDSGTFLSRLSGDDFALMYKYDDVAQVDDLLQRVSAAIGDIRLTLLVKEKVEIKCGISLFNDDTPNIISMLDEASMALMVAKSSPNTKFQYFNDDIQRIMLERELLEEELNEAYENQEFILYYQPKVDIKTEKLVGIEALIRWNHPEKGIVAPGAFIPVAEEIGLITKIDEWGMREACRQNKKWQDQGLSPVKMSVNVSQAQFYETDIVNTIKNILDETGLNAKWLDIELTETMAMKDIDRTIEILNEISDLGCSISMDDFGSGYSSLSSLKIIPIDILKIDRSLVIDVETNAASKHITTAIVNLAKSMEVTVLAEGIETKGQSNFLADLNVDLAQGFLFGKPCAPVEFIRFFENR